MVVHRWCASAVCLLALTDLACTGEQVTFAGLRDADRIEVTTSHAKVSATIRDPDTIAAVQAMIGRHDLGWSTPWFGTPVPTLQVNFYRGSRLLGGFGLGEDFLTSDPGPKFMMRSVPATETQEIARLLGVVDLVPRLRGDVLYDRFEGKNGHQSP